jgi:hypothetical protein
MRIFGGDSSFQIPSSADQSPRTPLDLLLWSVFACLKSHVAEIDPSAVLEIGMSVTNNRLIMVFPHSCADVMEKALPECYILKLLKIDYEIDINDKRFQSLKEKSV